VQVDNPWDAFVDDQLGLMDHLGIREFFYMGYCIGGCFAGKLMQRAPNRVVAAVFCQTVGHRPENPTVMYSHSKDNWVPDFVKRRPDVSTDTIEKYLHNLYAVQPDFLYSVPRDFIRNCRRIEALGQSDFVTVDCAACHHVTLLTPDFLLQLGLSPQAKDNERVRCRGCGARPCRNLRAKSADLKSKLFQSLALRLVRQPFDIARESAFSA
jgi:pimeloyl-ACP methyl ester carboxylesterase